MSKADVTTILGRVGSGKTRAALRLSLESEAQEILYITDEITEMEFGVIINDLFKGSKVFFGGWREVIIDDYARITFRYKGEMKDCSYEYEAVVVDICDGYKYEYKKFATKDYIITGQLNASDRFIILD